MIVIAAAGSMRLKLRTHCVTTRTRPVVSSRRISEPVSRNAAWLSEELINSLVELHHRGLAKSVEVWQNDELVGGLYGIQIGKVFCGESMFAKVSNASKAGFINFIQSHTDDIELIDCQIHSEHLESLGAKMISKRDYLKILKNNTNHES